MLDQRNPAEREGTPACSWAEAGLAARLLAADPHGFGGAVLRAPAGPVRRSWRRATRPARPCWRGCASTGASHRGF
ncbi:hypothetical protein MOF8_01880 [Methylobacterium oryzae]